MRADDEKPVPAADDLDWLAKHGYERSPWYRNHVMFDSAYGQIELTHEGWTARNWNTVHATARAAAEERARDRAEGSAKELNRAVDWWLRDRGECEFLGVACEQAREQVAAALLIAMFTEPKEPKEPKEPPQSAP